MKRYVQSKKAEICKELIAFVSISPTLESWCGAK